MSKERLPTGAEARSARWIAAAADALAAFRATRRSGIPAELAPSDAPATEEYSYELGGMLWCIRRERGWYVYAWQHPVERSARTLEQAEALLFDIAREELADHDGDLAGRRRR